MHILRLWEDSGVFWENPQVCGEHADAFSSFFSSTEVTVLFTKKVNNFVSPINYCFYTYFMLEAEVAEVSGCFTVITIMEDFNGRTH